MIGLVRDMEAVFLEDLLNTGMKMAMLFGSSWFF